MDNEYINFAFPDYSSLFYICRPCGLFEEGYTHVQA